MGGVMPKQRSSPREERPTVADLEGDLPSDRAAAINRSRQEKYGHPADVYQHTAAIWTGLLFGKLKAPIEMHEVGLMLGGHKMAREVVNPNVVQDNLDDTVGAINTVAMVYERAKE